MQVPAEFIRPFPSYEDVFYDNLEEHRRHFLPLCSVNLRTLDAQGPDEWVHFVSAKEIRNGRVGELTTDTHTRFCGPDRLGFEVIDGKYRFEAGWDYFLENQVEQLEAKVASLPATEKEQSEVGKRLQLARTLRDEVYPTNMSAWETEKEHYAATGTFTKYSDADVVEDLGYQKEEIQWLLEEVEAEMKPEGEFLSADERAEELFPNLSGELPLDDNGHILPYVGYLPGYQYQKHGADAVVLFYDPALARAVICFEYS